MSTINKNKDGINISQLNEDIELFRQVHPITNDMKLTHDGVSRLVMLDRYAFKDTEKKTLKKGDFVVLTIKADSRSEEHTSELQSRGHLVCRLLLEKKNASSDRIAEK